MEELKITRERAIKRMKWILKHEIYCSDKLSHAAINMAITALRSAAPENKPLTLEQLQIENAQLRAVIIKSDPDFFKRKCRVCGCDWNHPCNDHDCWVEDDLCSACAARKPEGSEKP